MKAHRYISIILTLCFSVFLGHNLIPHHHHSEQVIVPESTKCPVDHGDTEKHCHAFNDVVFDKYNSIHTLAIPSIIAAVAPKPAEILSVYFQFKIPDKPSDYFGDHSLRGPPVVA